MNSPQIHSFDGCLLIESVKNLELKNNSVAVVGEHLSCGRAKTPSMAQRLRDRQWNAVETISFGKPVENRYAPCINRSLADDTGEMHSETPTKAQDFHKNSATSGGKRVTA